MKRNQIAVSYAILAAALYAINIPFSKLFLQKVEPAMMASLLYLGAGIGLFLYGKSRDIRRGEADRNRLTRKEMPYVIAMVLLDVVAPILLMLGIQRTTSANASLLNNFEIVATSLIALGIFREIITRRLWVAIGLVTVASILLSYEGQGSFVFNEGSLLVLGAALCWGFENNCTKMLSAHSTTQIVTIKGIFSGMGSFLVAMILRESLPTPVWIGLVLLLGFVSYGLSINFYIKAQKDLGAAKTSAFYSIAPFLGVGFSMLLLGERPGIRFYSALAVMSIATWMMIKDSLHDKEESRE